MADYAGALAAIKARLVAGWTTTRITFQNEQPEQPWPPKRANGSAAPWVNLEVMSTGSQIWTFGTVGNRGWRYDGFISVHVFTPVGEGVEQAFQYAVTIGEIFRAAEFYEDGNGNYIRTLAPQIGGGESGSDDGKWFRVTMTVDFTYWHRA
jgi:hypothetical protein